MRERIGADDQRGVDFAPLQCDRSRRLAGQVLGKSAGEADRGGEASLPGEHLGGARAIPWSS